jgi:hypothetical protein
MCYVWFGGWITITSSGESEMRSEKVYHSLIFEYIFQSNFISNVTLFCQHWRR